MGVDKPNYTQIPNIILDDFIMCMGDAEFKVVLAIARQTFGYHRERYKMSLAGLMELTGLSRQGVINGINAGIERGVIDREAAGDGFTYAIVINDPTSQRSRPVNEVDQQGSQPNGLPLVNEVDQASQRSRPEVVNEVDLSTPVLKKELKKGRKKELKKETASQPTPKPPTAQQEMFGAVCEAVGWDHRIITDRAKSQVAQTVGILLKNNYTVDDVRRFMTEIWFNDWRWEKNNSYPKLSQLREEIGKLRSIVPSAAPKPQSKSMNSLHRLQASLGANS